MKPVFFPEALNQGPWGVDAAGGYWYVCHLTSGRKKRIGRVGARAGYNYFDRAMDEAHRRNKAENALL